LYLDPAGKIDIDLFIGFFKTQREGQSPHSPKNCLPGNGWQPIETGLVPIQVPGRAEPIVANRYVASHGDDKAVVIYWYQSHNRIVASEYSAKFWLIADSIRYHRSDTALVKIVVPVVSDNAQAATAMGVSFVEAMFPDLLRQLPK
jgi:EpsI family protein